MVSHLWTILLLSLAFFSATSDVPTVLQKAERRVPAKKNMPVCYFRKLRALYLPAKWTVQLSAIYFLIRSEEEL